MITKAEFIRHYYDELRDHVFWDVKLPDGSTQTIMCKRCNFGPAWKIPCTKTIPISLINEFMDKLIGQTINVDIGGAGPADPESIM